MTGRRGSHLGVDGGNSKTLAVVCASDGTVLGFGRRGNGDIYGAHSTDAAIAAVTDAVAEALQTAGIAADALASAAYRLAGVDWAEDREFWAGELGRRQLAPTPATIENDALAAIRCAGPSGVGVGVVVGTGCGVSARRRSTHCLCWWIRGPQGAGGLGEDALEAVYAEAMGLGPPTRLTRELLNLYDARTVEHLLHTFTRRWGVHPDTAQAAPLVSTLARDGDQVACAIIDLHARGLAAYAGVAAERARLAPDDPMPLVLTGSVLTAAGSPLAEALTARLARELPQARPCRAELPPVAGAALDAIAESGQEVTREIMNRLGQTLPAYEEGGRP